MLIGQLESHAHPTARKVGPCDGHPQQVCVKCSRSKRCWAESNTYPSLMDKISRDRAERRASKPFSQCLLLSWLISQTHFPLSTQSLHAPLLLGSFPLDLSLQHFKLNQTSRKHTLEVDVFWYHGGLQREIRSCFLCD